MAVCHILHRADLLQYSKYFRNLSTKKHRWKTVPCHLFLETLAHVDTTASTPIEKYRPF